MRGKVISALQGLGLREAGCISGVMAYRKRATVPLWFCFENPFLLGDLCCGGDLWAHPAPEADHCLSGSLQDGTPFWESLPFLGILFLDTPTCPVADGCGGEADFPKKERKLPKCS